ncbi:MAG: hemin ABC transporter substrate-binding protein, partial [Hyphomicrobiaceae bacterium]
MVRDEQQVCGDVVGRLSRFGACLVALTLAAHAQVGTASHAKQVQERIVSLGGDATEILYDLGLDGQIVAVDTTSLSPPRALKEKASVGYLRQLSAEGVLSTGATTIVASDQAGPPEVVNALKAANLKVVMLPGNAAPGNIAEKVRVIGRIFAREAQAEVLARRIEDGFRHVTELRAHIKTPAKALFVLGVRNGRAMVGGAATTADTMLKLAGAVNAAANING